MGMKNRIIFTLLAALCSSFTYAQDFNVPVEKSQSLLKSKFKAGDRIICQFEKSKFSPAEKLGTVFSLNLLDTNGDTITLAGSVAKDEDTVKFFVNQTKDYQDVLRFHFLALSKLADEWLMMMHWDNGLLQLQAEDQYGQTGRYSLPINGFKGESVVVAVSGMSGTIGCGG